MFVVLMCFNLDAIWLCFCFIVLQLLLEGGHRFLVCLEFFF
uniref:Uncharacterized protein n=1 Tax=Rhizophora mucronata TaxID=61149 RepID=A0A2P2JF48_RHIMU